VVRSAVGAQVGADPETRRSTAPGPRRWLIGRALLIVGATGLFMAGGGAPLALAGLGDAGLGDTAPSVSWDSTNALMLDATPGTGASATILNNTAAPLDVALQVDVPAAIAVTPATLSIPAGGTKAIKVGVLDPAVPGSYVVTAVAGPAPGTVIRRSVTVGPTAAPSRWTRRWPPLPSSSLCCSLPGCRPWLSARRSAPPLISCWPSPGAPDQHSLPNCWHPPSKAWRVITDLKDIESLFRDGSMSTHVDAAMIWMGAHINWRGLELI